MNIKSMMQSRNIKFLLPLLILLCCTEKHSTNIAPSSLYPQAQKVAANPEGGYLTNTVSGDTIQPLINSLGDTIKTGIAIPTIGKIIHPDSVAQPKSFPLPVNDKLNTKNADLNVHKIPDNLIVITVNKNSLKQIPLVEIAKNDTTHYFINSKGEKVKTGVPIPVKGKVVKTTQPQPTKAFPPAVKDAANANFQYLDVEQGMLSSNVSSILEDMRGNLWFSTQGEGITKYNGHSFTHYTEKQGLSKNAVMSILEDKRGNLWFGTYGGGVSKYDGTIFTHYTEKEGLCNNRVFSMLEDRKGNLWFGTYGGGVTKFNGSSFTHYTEREGLSNNRVSYIMEDKSGNLWFGTDGGVTKYNGSSFTHYTEKDGLSNNRVFSILEDKSGNFWFSTFGGGVTKYNGSSFTHYTEKEGLSYNNVFSSLEDKSGNLWFGTYGGGVTKYNGSSFTHYTEKEGLSNNTLLSMTEDRNGNLWFGTFGGGVTKFNESSFTHYAEKEGFTENRVFSILEDKRENLWFGTHGGGVTKYNGSSFTHYTEKEGLSNTSVKSILEDRRGNLWFGTLGGGVTKYNGNSFMYYTEKEGLSNDFIFSIFEDKSGNIWFGTYDGGVTKYNPESNVGKGKSSFTHYTEKEGFNKFAVSSILEDKSGNIWFGTDGGGVTKFNGSSFTHYTEKEGLCSNRVSSIYEDKRGNLWIGTYGGGVTNYNGSSFTHFTEKEGLSNNTISFILEDHEGRIWLSTDKGLTFFAVDKLGIPLQNKGEIKEDQYGLVRFGKNDGLKYLDFHSACFDSKNRIWWGSGKNITMLDLNKYSTSINPPTVKLRQLDINEQFIDYRNVVDNSDSFLKSNELEFNGVQAFENYPLHLELPYDKNHLTFHFAAIDWSAPHKIKYSYLMDGLDNAWSIPSDKPIADYRNLTHGTYTFKIRAIGESREWSEPFDYTFTINPPWWRTWWAYMFYALFFISALRTFSLWQERKLRREKELLQNKVEERTFELKQSLEDLKSTQAQLIQSEKMASLGELTAGIAHEIQNPLNFVNNFSELGVDLAKELEEEIVKLQIPEKDHQYIIEIISDLSQNQEKINHHGKRASDIVKGMLDHSRKSTGEKTLTDINALCDEYLRLSYHGLRAKDKSFNADFELIASPDLTKINVIHQDMGRVLLNLINNAFWAVNDMKIKLGDTSDYKPKVTIVTKTFDNYIEINVKDNGVGIPKDKVGRIFQPFFTTKPTGQGTGLGLSLSYDIVKAHGGELNVESIENEGSTFIIQLPSK